MRIPSGKTDQHVYFLAESTTGGPKTGLSSFTIWRSRNGGALTSYTTPTVTELSSANAPGYYELLIDEDTTIASNSDSEMMLIVVTATGMKPRSIEIELYRRTATSGQTITATSGGVTLADGVSHGGTLGSSTATLALSRASIVSQTTNTAALTVTGNGTGSGVAATGGASGNGVTLNGGATTGDGLKANANGGNSSGINTTGHGSGHGLKAMGGDTTGSGIHARANTAATGDADGFSCVGAKNGGGATFHGGSDTGAGTGNGPGIYASCDGAGYAAQFYAGPNAFGAMLIDAGGGPTDCTGLDIRGKGGWSGCKISSPGGQALEITGYWGIGVYSTDHALEMVASAADAIYAEANGTDKYALNLNSESTLLNPAQVAEMQAGLSTLDAAGVRSSVGLASANLDTQLGDLPTNSELSTALASADDATLSAISAIDGKIDTIDGVVDAILVDTAEIGAAGAGLTAVASSVLTTQMTEAYAADGVAPTLAQAIFAMHQFLLDREISGTTMTVRKLDGTTSAMTFTLDSATAPTTSHRTA